MNMLPCTQFQALEILRDPTVLPFLSIYPVGIKDVETYLLDGKALVIVMPQNDKAEIHIACKRKDRAYLRGSMVEGLNWLKARGFKQVFTTAPCQRTALINLLKALNFKESEGVWVWE